MPYSKCTILKVFIRTAKVSSLQFHSYHRIFIIFKKQNTFVWDEVQTKI